MGPLYFIKRLTFFGATVFFASFVVLWGLSQVERTLEEPRLALISSQIQRLSELESPKIVLVGGSNLAYGMNSPMLSDAVNMPVMNMGVQVALTLEFMLELIKPHLHAGDVVVLGAEYAMYESKARSTVTLLRMAAADPSSMMFMSRRQLPTLPVHLYSALWVQGQQLKRSVARKIYGKPSFSDGHTETGDYVGHRGKSSQYETGPNNVVFSRYASIPAFRAQYLQEFSTYCQNLGVRILVTFTPAPVAAMDEHHLDVITSFLEDRFTVISDPWDYAYPDSAFYDFEHHLIYDMRDTRTRQLIDDLLPHLE